MAAIIEKMIDQERNMVNNEARNKKEHLETEKEMSLKL